MLDAAAMFELLELVSKRWYGVFLYLVVNYDAVDTLHVLLQYWISYSYVYIYIADIFALN